MSDKLVETIIEGIRELKGMHIVSIDFSNLENTVCKYFVICHADSNVHVNAIVDSVEKFVHEKLSEKVWHREGTENGQWVLLDYADVVVHVFQTQTRQFYNLEALWADAQIKHIE